MAGPAHTSPGIENRGKTRSIAFTLPVEQAYALAELCKRFGYEDALSLSVDDAEARRQIAATDELRAALERANVWVR